MSRASLRTWSALAPALAACVIAGACGDANAPPGSADTLAADTSATLPDTSPRDTTSADTSLCAPDTLFCVSARVAGVCNAAGDGAATTTPCSGATACEPATGLCRPTICEPDRLQCLNLTDYQLCAPDGSTWSATSQCAPERFCADGQCRACPADRFECLSETSYRQCASDSSSWVGPLECPDDHTCLGRACEPCELTTECLGPDRMRRYCANPVVAYDETIACGAEQACADGRCTLCEPNEVTCLSESTYKRCAPDGLAWGSDTTCSPAQVCLAAGCVPELCAPRVLLLVDKSGSMWSHWQSVRQSIATLAAANPNFRFALKSFPSGSSSCGVDGGLDVPFAQNNGAALDAWFVAYGPTSLTPLVAGVEAVFEHAEAFFAGQAGSLIVLSDGQDTCAGSSTAKVALAVATSSLYLEHGITTYAIGYAFGGDVGELDTIANNGATAFFTHIPAGNEAELTAAFAEVADDIKVCDPPTLPTPP